jgi:heme A synthase
MATPRPARRRPSLRGTCAIIFLLGISLVVLGGWGLVRGTGRDTVALGFGAAIVLGALLIVFAALLPWLGDGPVRLGPLAVTLRIRERTRARSRRRRSRRRR